jgi:N-acetylated-alpha-linked acidic dipeptidase
MLRVLLALVLAAAAAAQPPVRGFSGDALAAQRALESTARALPSPAQLRAYMQRMAAAPHHAGSAGSRAVAQYALEQMQSWGLEAHLETFEALLPYPTQRVLEVPGFRASLTEPPLAADPGTAAASQIPAFNAYSAAGDVTAPLVYVNYGTAEDYAFLESQGIDVRGKIVIARYGRIWRGLKPKLAQERGAVGCILYSDPHDDGFFVGHPYPDGPMRPAHGVQRGSVVDMAVYPGDPLTPGWPSEPGARRLTIEEARTILKIPVLPISWADAQPLLERLEGPLAPEAWRGALPLTYHLGPSAVRAHLQLEFDWSIKPIYNVVATIPGTSDDTQWILYGNHHDAWVNGASDPVSGAAVLLETARVLAQLRTEGWRPRRTIQLALWDAEEFGLIGSTEWVEKHADELRRRAAVYLNTDSNGIGLMSAGGSPLLEPFIEEVLRDVTDPRGGFSILETLRRAASGATSFDPQNPPGVPLGALGSGSDYVAFLHHLGIASLNLGFGAPPGQYHSSYDTIGFFERFSDGDRRYAVALTQVMLTAILRLASAPVLPFSPEALARATARQIEELRLHSPPDAHDSIAAALAENQQMLSAAQALESALAAAPAVPEPVNAQLAALESAFVTEAGLPGRDWYRHLLYAPGLLTGYAAKTLPGVREALEAKDWERASREAGRLSEALREATRRIEAMTAFLKTR